MPATNAHISYGCETDGTGYIQVDSVYSDLSETITINFTHAGGAYGPYEFPALTTPYKISSVANAFYSTTVVGTESGAGEVYLNGDPTAVPGGEFEVDCFLCDLEITSLTVEGTTRTGANGSVDIIASGAFGAKEYSIDGVTWDEFWTFEALAEGYYTAYVRYVDHPACVASEPFYVGWYTLFGCTNPDADNYEPEATDDGGTCEFTPKYYATGGTLPNPVYFQRSFGAYEPGPLPILKTRHYITVNLYTVGSSTPFATVKQRVRNGIAKVDIAKELRQGPLILDTSIANIYADGSALYAFEVGYVESYGTTTEAEVRTTEPKRYAVRAALPGLTDTLTPYVVSPDAEVLAKFLTSFEEPVKFHDEPVYLAAIIDPGVTTPVWFERSYYDVYNRLVERKSTEVTQRGYVRLTVNDAPLPCASYVEAVLTDAERLHEGDCIDLPPDPEPPTGGTGSVTIKDGAGNTLATVPAGSVFVIESGFSFGFRIL